MNDKEYAEILKGLLVPIHAEPAMDRAIELLEQEPCDTCEVGNPCLYCKHEFEERSGEE